MPLHAHGTGPLTVREHRIEVTRTARYYTLGEPGPRVRQVWIACHGYRQLAARFIQRLRPLDDDTRLVVAPEALSRFYLDDDGGPHGPEARIGASWMTREDRLNEIRDYVGYLDALYDRIFQDLDREQVELAVLGFSQGAATATRWTVYGRARVDRLVLWAGVVPPDLDLEHDGERLRAARLTLVAGTEDPLVSMDAVAREEERLRAHDVPYRLVTWPGRHRVDGELLQQLAESEWKATWAGREICPLQSPR